MKTKAFFLFIFYSVIQVAAQTTFTVKNYPINITANPTLVVIDYITGESTSYWNTANEEHFNIPMGENLLNNITIFDQNSGGKSIFIRKGDHVTYDFETKEIHSLKYNYALNDFKLTTISKSENWDRYVQDKSVSEDFTEILRKQNQINHLNFKDIPTDFPKGLPMYRMKLYEYLNAEYSLSTKRTEGNNLYADYLKHFHAIYQDTMISKKTLSSYVFTKLNVMGTATTKEDFAKAFALFKKNTDDLNAVTYIKNEYFLEENLDDRLNVGIIDGDKKQIKYEHLIKQNRGKYIIIDFWASWCAPCLTSIPESLDLKTKYQNNVTVLYISLDKTFNPWKNAEKKFNIPKISSYLIVNGMQKDLEIDKIKISTIPRYFFYDPKGNLINSSLEDIAAVTHLIETIVK